MKSRCRFYLLPVFVAMGSMHFLHMSTVRLDGDEPDETTFSATDVEFFEKKIRPILVNRCYECHSADAKKLRGELRVDSRSALLKGGETGPAIEPGKADESLLVDAIRYGDSYQMPPKSKMPQAEIDLLVDWVGRGAPWPHEKAARAHEETKEDEFNFKERRDSHWCWKPITAPKTPQVKAMDWAKNDIDRFILARLEQAKLSPAPRAQKSVLLRRAYFDLVGLPPTPAQLDAFLNDDSSDAFEKVVNELLESPHFAERWARHWLDLVRYAESRGHEFDYDTPNAFEYRDYVIRAIDQDVPYDQFLVEHLAGDLLESPRRDDPSGFNESVLGTGFWFLGEWIHSPVDIRQDETDRFDNMIDVFTKSFLGLTVACARCHDHKFDAIRQQDYYALTGYLQSSAYRQVRFETELEHRQLQRELEDLESKFSSQFWRQLQQDSREGADELAAYLEAAAEIARKGDVAVAADEIVVDDFESGDFSKWTATGEVFAGGPVSQTSIAKYQGDVGAAGEFFVNTHNIPSESGVRSGDQWTGTLTSQPFKIERDAITMLVGGGSHANQTCVDLLVGGKRVLTATGKSNNRMFPVRWDVRRWIGQSAQIRIVDQAKGGWGNIGVDQIVQTSSGNDVISVSTISPTCLDEIQSTAERRKLAPDRLALWVAHLATAATPAHSSDPLHDLVKAKPTAPRAIATETATRPSFSYRFENHLLADGVSFGRTGIQAGALVLGNSPDAPLDGVAVLPHARRRSLWESLRLAGGYAKDGGRLGKWDRAGKTVRTPTFEQTADESLYYLVRGKGVVFAVVSSHRMLNGPLHGSVLKEFDTGGKLQWIDQDLRRYVGRNLHVEFSATDASPLEVYEVRMQRAGERPTLDADLVDHVRRATSGRTDDAAAIAGALNQAWGGATIGDRMLQSWIVRHAELFVSKETSQSWRDSSYWNERRALAERVRSESRTAMAIWDGDGRDEHLLIRGNHKTPGPVATRSNLAAFGQGAADLAPSTGSGRLQLARQLATIDNPLTARVAVNRVWGHLTGRGIVASTDNFGVLGQPPTHPELLDHLATRFVDQGWSVKQLIREIMLSQTYQMSSQASGEAMEADPTNQLLHSMRIRRLEGEVIRDAILAVSGRLDKKMYGPSVPVYLTPFMQGRGRPGGGPLDGNGRRSVYISVRRNFLSPMMLAFDTPQPFNTVGTRSVSNVPAQALIMLNDPLVAEQSKRWATESIKLQPGDAEARLELLFRQAFSRPIRAAEKKLMLGFVQGMAAEKEMDKAAVLESVEIWTEVCHTLLNMKEFVFVL